MKNLTREQAIEKLNNLLEDEVQANFMEQEKKAGEHGDSTFLVSNRKGFTAEVEIDWNKEADLLTYSITENGEEEN
ncbi:hypothetical protein [Oceanobacillus damuensis]|uniref:hypothetical protein n=1 Tax=Oceanobacillus damuensis TaxID=937928 RepID=UPI00082F1BCD|nr:hypothetical protein [Oceanobacillus damuensis]